MTAVDGRCLLGHRVDQSTISSRRGRRISGGTASGLAVLDRAKPVAEHAPRATPRPTPVRPLGPHNGDRLIDTGQQRAIPTQRPHTVVARRSNTTEEARPSAGVDLNPTGEMVIQLWDDTPDEPALESWKSEEALSAMPERSGMRILSVGLLLIAVVAMVVAISLAFGAGVSPVEELRGAADELQTTLDRFDSSGNPSFTQVDAAARGVLDVAQDLAIGDPTRAIAIDAAGRVLDAERSLSEALAYHTRFVVFVGRPSLPTATSDLSQVTTEFTAWSTSLTEVVDPVPDAVAFDDHRAVVAEFLTESQRIQARYLDALRAEKPRVAAQALADLDTAVTTIATSLESAVTQARQDFEASIADASVMLDRIPDQS